MEPERWKQIDQLLEAALDRPPSQRAAFLNQACAGDEALRREVESLLSSDGQANSFIEAPAFEVAAELLAEDQTQTLVGQHIGRYRLLSLLGTGGMGEVYLAQDSRLGRQVALKLLPASFTRDQERVRRFEQEARAASRLSHPNICVIHEVGETDDGRHFITMEYIDGVTLRQHMTNPQMRLGEALDIAIQAASGLSAAHQAGIVHRDVKPENIMLRTDSLAKVLDFGLAKLTEQPAIEVDSRASPLARVDTDPGTIMGTASYMSPEQARGLKVDARTDIWSLGVVLYEMVAGRAPFEGETTSDGIVAILDREPLPLEHHRSGVPTELQKIVSKALSKNREDRYQTVEELVIDLKSLKRELESGSRNETVDELAKRTS
jgi:eukaryotic-like serine/threonine-protein kinase